MSGGWAQTSTLGPGYEGDAEGGEEGKIEIQHFAFRVLNTHILILLWLATSWKSEGGGVSSWLLSPTAVCIHDTLGQVRGSLISRDSLVLN